MDDDDKFVHAITNGVSGGHGEPLTAAPAGPAVALKDEGGSQGGLIPVERLLRVSKWHPNENTKVQQRALKKAGPLPPADQELLREYPRPHKRSECLPTVRWWGGAPCPYVSCHFHLGVDVLESGGLKVLKDWDDGRSSCTLDMADEGGMTLDEIGKLLGLTRERVRQIEVRGLAKLGFRAPAHELNLEK